MLCPRIKRMAPPSRAAPPAAPAPRPTPPGRHVKTSRRAHGRPRGCDRRPVRSPRARADGTDLAPHALNGMYHVRPAPARRTTPPADPRRARGPPAASHRVSPAGLPPVSHRPIFKDRSPTARARTHTAYLKNKYATSPQRSTHPGRRRGPRARGAPRNPSAPLRRVPRRALEA